jgi:acyl-CoA hydrolase
MLTNTPIHGLDVLALMATGAADRAARHLPGAIRLARSDRVELIRGGAVDLESWVVARDRDSVVVAVFATTSQPGGGRRIAGSGRFTFVANAEN